ncbi:MAG: PRC-barrel domain-containing protein, partial [bacterium]|nr:PRC-barrel domain-containing protein [bacterium]
STIPTITADVTITNEGSVAYEYPYEYCVVSQQSNQCGGGDDIDYGSGSKLIAAGESWNPSLTLNVNDAGTYWFKVSVTYGAQTAGASKSFEAVSATVGSGGTGGGGGGDSDITARVIVPMYKFDISAEVLENYKIIKPGENIVIEYIMYNLGTEEIKDAIFSYSIKDADENIVISETEEKVAILTELKIVREITLPEDLREGTYYVNAKLQYSDKIIGAIDSFIVLKKDKIAEEEPEVLNIKIDKSYLIMGGIGLGILILFIFILIIIIRKKRKNRKINDLESKLKHLDELKERNKINKSVYHSEREKLLQSIRNVFKGNAKYIIALLIGIFAYMILINSSHITGYSIEGMILDNIELTGSVLILVIALSLLIFVYRQKIKEFIEKILGYPDNHVRGLIKKKVYVSHGDYIGKIEDVMLGDNKIYGLKIKLDKKKFAGKRILVRWKHVKSCGEIVMIDSNVVKAMGDSDEK